MDVYLPFSITVLILVTLSFIFRKIEKSRPNMKFLWLSSIVPLAMALSSSLLNLYTPYASHSLLDCLFGCLLRCDYPIFRMVGSIAHLFSGNWYEDLVWQNVAFVVSFVFYTLLIFLVIRIVLSLKKKFWSGNAPANRE